MFGATGRPFSIRSPWFAGRAEIQTYSLDELLATKLRALYQRRKGRDLFDRFVMAINRLTSSSVVGPCSETKATPEGCQSRPCALR